MNNRVDVCFQSKIFAVGSVPIAGRLRGRHRDDGADVADLSPETKGNEPVILCKTYDIKDACEPGAAGIESLS